MGCWLRFQRHDPAAFLAVSGALLKFQRRPVKYPLAAKPACPVPHQLAGLCRLGDSFRLSGCCRFLGKCLMTDTQDTTKQNKQEQVPDWLKNE